MDKLLILAYGLFIGLILSIPVIVIVLTVTLFFNAIFK